MTTVHENVVARLTPPGKSAIACLGIAGPRACDAVRSLFRRPRGTPLPDVFTPHGVYFGSLGDEASGADDVVLFIRDTAPAFVAEINCHGGPEVVLFLESLFVARGLDTVAADAWNILVHGVDRDAMLDILTRCPTTRTAAIALDQLSGAFDRASAAIGALVAAGRAHEAATKIARLRELIPVGEHLARPWKVVVAGEPNVGKSSLVNAVAGFTRSVVAPTPGTTRDVVSTAIALDGWPIELIDTAGLREAGDDLESEGIARSRIAADGADLILRVVDASAPGASVAVPFELLVINKIDLKPEVSILECDIAEAVLVSARTGDGLERLIAAIVNRLVPIPPWPGEAVPVTAAQRIAAGELSAAN